MADFRDPWTLSDTNLKHRSSVASTVDARIERSWLQQASMLSFTTDSTRKLYEHHYADLNLSTTTIYNAFDRALFEEKDSSGPDLGMDLDNLNLIFFGISDFDGCRHAWAKFIKILANLKKRAPETVEDIKIHSFGSLSEDDHRRAVENGLRDCFVTHSPVPVEQGLQVLQQADIQLLSTSPQRKDIIPAKLWDYLAAERPILSIAPNPEIDDILQETQAGVQHAPDDLQTVSELLKECVQAKKEVLAMPIAFSHDRQKVNQYSARAATQKLSHILDKHTA
ncbi:MAG: hypothetical protein U5J63_12935 [Fodinibius sp.]|nr:hypothetical protein [Fodinibius sp.]